MNWRIVQHAVIIAAIVLATAIVYAPVRHHPFIAYDDDAYVGHNPHVQGGLTPDGIRWAFTTYHGGNWHPLTWLSHMLDAQIVGDRPGGHHVSNALLHLANTILVYIVLLKLTGDAPPSALVALLFAIHPLHVESVAWVAERKDTLSTFFGLLTIWAYAAYVRSPSIRSFAIVCVLFTASLMSKPMFVTLPFALLLFDYWPLRRLNKSSIREKLPLIGLTAVFSVIAIFAQGHSGASSSQFTMAQRFANAAVAYVTYLRKTLIPTDLALGYPHPTIIGEPITATQLVTALAILLAITALSLWQRRNRPWLLVGWLWYLGTLVPVIGIMQIGAQGMADRYTYVPLIGIFILIGWTLWDLLPRSVPVNAIRAAVATVLIIVCTLLARKQVMYWSDTITLFTHTLDVAPRSYIAHDCLGVAHYHAKRPDLAMHHYRESLKLFPANPQSHNNMGVLLFEQKQIVRAIQHYIAAIKAQPQFFDAHNNLGNALVEAGRGDLAIEHYQAALRLDPHLPQAHNNLGLLLAERGRIDEAISHFRQAVHSDPTYANAHYSLALALAMRGQFHEAVAHDRTAVSLKPDFADALNHLASLLATSPDPSVRNPSEAVTLAQRAVDATGGQSIQPLDTLGIALAASGRFNEAAGAAERALKLATSTTRPAAATAALKQRLELYKSRASAASTTSNPATTTASTPRVAK